jgi:hypothetical protein
MIVIFNYSNNKLLHILLSISRTYYVILILKVYYAGNLSTISYLITLNFLELDLNIKLNIP